MITLKHRTYLRVFISLIVIGFFIFLTSVFFGNHNKIFENSNPNNTFKVVVYRAEVYNIFSLYKYFRGENYFFIVYDKCGNIAFKPSLFFGMDQSVAYGGFHFSRHDNNTLFFPTNYGIDSIELSTTKSECL